MRPAIAAGLLFAVQPAPALSQAPPAAVQAPVEIATIPLADGIYQFTVAADGYVQQLNSVAVITEKDVLLFDTTTRPSTARSILAKLRTLTDKPVRFVVNSHWHPDHWSGNEAVLAAFPEAEIISTEKQRDFMQNMSALWPDLLPKALAGQEQTVAERFASGKDSAGDPMTPAKRRQIETELQMIRDLVAEQVAAKRTYPTLTFTDELRFRHGGREFHLMSVTGDAAATTVLHLPKERILITGDTVSHPLPYFTPPLSEHARSIRRLAALNPAIIVPGHGPAFRDTGYMLLEAELFDEVLRQVQAALRGGAVSIDAVNEKVNFDAFRDRFARGDADVARQFDGFTRGMVRRAYIELRDTKEIR